MGHTSAIGSSRFGGPEVQEELARCINQLLLKEPLFGDVLSRTGADITIIEADYQVLYANLYRRDRDIRLEKGPRIVPTSHPIVPSKGSTYV